MSCRAFDAFSAVQVAHGFQDGQQIVLHGEALKDARLLRGSHAQLGPALYIGRG